MPVQNGLIACPPALLLAVFFSAHPNNFTLDTALPWILSNTPTKCEVDRMNGCRDKYWFDWLIFKWHCTLFYETVTLTAKIVFPWSDLFRAPGASTNHLSGLSVPEQQGWQFTNKGFVDKHVPLVIMSVRQGRPTNFIYIQFPYSSDYQSGVCGTLPEGLWKVNRDSVIVTVLCLLMYYLFITYFTVVSALISGLNQLYCEKLFWWYFLSKLLQFHLVAKGGRWDQRLIRHS